MSLIDQLIEDSRPDLVLGQSSAYGEASFDAAAATEAAGQIAARPNAESFVLAMALRRAEPEAYASVPADARAAVLTDALRTRHNLNDFGYLEESGAYDGAAARALLELGDAAAPALAALLSDDRPAPLMGSEMASMAELYGYRRKDFAYHYLTRLLGHAPEFPRDPAQRDGLIAKLQQDVA